MTPASVLDNEAMNIRRALVHRIIFATLALALGAARAATALSLPQATAGEECQSLGSVIAALDQMRDRGLTREQAAHTIETVLGSPPASELVEDVYAFRELSELGLFAAEYWRCEARAAGAKPPPLRVFAGEVATCFSPRPTEYCDLRLRSRVLIAAQRGGQDEPLPPEPVMRLRYVPTPSRPPPTQTVPAMLAEIAPVAGHAVSGKLVLSQASQRQVRAEISLAGLVPGQAFEIRFESHNACERGAPSTTPARPVFARETMRGGSSGTFARTLPFDGIVLGDGPDSIRGLTVGVHATAEQGGAALGCGDLGAQPGFTAQIPQRQPYSPRDEVRTCMDAEAGIATLVERGEADDDAVDAARKRIVGEQPERSTLEALERQRALQAAHALELRTALSSHGAQCGRLLIDPADRAAILKERQGG